MNTRTMFMFLFIRRDNQLNTNGNVLDVTILLKDTSTSCYQTQDQVIYSVRTTDVLSDP